MQVLTMMHLNSFLLDCQLNIVYSQKTNGGMKLRKERGRTGSLVVILVESSRQSQCNICIDLFIPFHCCFSQRD